ncbi:hypothetical protein AB0I53_19480 [Saccharopolyspora sp. NPDC050389]|uniref:hypothetical protein n=1 Tax=Saccharopolyspora sp. NPDC050389 TaxID=3155516 RepID=UPI0033CFB379
MSDDENVGEPADESGEGGDAEEHIELTPEQQVALRRTMESIQQSLVRKVRLPKSTLPESTLKNIAAISRIAEAQHALVAHAIKPFLDAQSAWQKQFASISSDIFKSHALAQSNLNLVASQLTRNIDFSAFAAAGQIAEKFTAQQATWLKNIGPAIAAMRAAAFYPPNLRSIGGLKLEEVEQVVMVDGIPLYGLPRTAIAEALIRADGASGRREILGRRWKSISADCRMAIEGCGYEAVSPYIPFAVAGLDALDAGHTEAAQALAGSLVDAILSSYFGKDRYKYTPDKNGKRTKDAYDEFNVRQFIAFAPMWQAYQKFFVTGGDKVPMTFSRNATAHTVSPRQFNRRNAVQGLMVACSLLCRLDEEARALEAGREA